MNSNNNSRHHLFDGINKNNDTKMQPQKQQLGSKSEHDHKLERSRDETDDSSISIRQNKRQEHSAEGMNSDDNKNNAAIRTRDQYEGMGEWTSFSPATTKLFSGYNFSDIGRISFDVGAPNTNAGQFFAQDENRGIANIYAGNPTPLTPEEQATDTSYTMLASKRNPMSTAAIDGRIQEPHLNDILCGRGGSINSHPGNRVFRGWIAERRESYNLAESKADKSRITSEIMERVQDQGPPGRFLQKIVEGDGSRRSEPYTLGGYWFEIDDSKALAKISQALREGAPAFRALRGKKGRKTTPPRRMGSRRSKHEKEERNNKQAKAARTRRHKQKESDAAHELSPGDQLKEPPKMEEAFPAGVMQEVALQPPLPPNGPELDVLFPTSNNVFATANYQPNGNLLNSYPLVHMGDYTASIDDVAGAIPPTPATVEKLRVRANTPVHMEEVKMPGKCNDTPTYPLTPAITPLVSPGFSPYGQAKAAWDAIAFLPNLSPDDRSPVQNKKPKILQRVHSLSFSSGDVNSIGSFNNPFENENGKSDQELPPPREPETEETPYPSEVATFPPPTSITRLDPRPAPPRGLSFGRIGSVPGGNGNNHNHRNSSFHSHRHRNGSRHRSNSRRESNHSLSSSKSWGSSISNFHNSKRKSIA